MQIIITKTDSDRFRAIFAGTLYFLGTIAGILSIAPAVDNPDFLIMASLKADQVLLAGLFQFVMTIAYTGFAITLYPVLRKQTESLALGFLSFRIIAATLNIIGIIIILLILRLSSDFIKDGSPVSSYYQTIGTMLRSGRDFINHIAMILAISTGGLMFYSLLYLTKILPRWLPVCGLAGTLLTITASLLVMFNVIDIITSAYFLLNIPLILVETLLAIWLISKGFDQNVINSVCEKG